MAKNEKPSFIGRALNYLAGVQSTKEQPTQNKRAYDAASGGRLGIGNARNGFLSSTTSADTEIFSAGRLLRDRSRDLTRNNPHASKAIDSLVRNIIGEGITPRPKLDDRDANNKVTAAFNAWCKAQNCDFDGQQDFIGIQTLALREMLEGGEVLIKRITPPKGDYEIPLQIQILEADMLDSFRNGPLENNNLTIQGVEIASSGPKAGKRVAYWLYPQHPGSLFFNLSKPMISVPVPVDQVLHVYEKQRTQVRGTPWGTPSFENLKNLGDYELAEIVRKKLEACATAFITTEDSAQLGWNQIDPMNPEANPVGIWDTLGNPIESFEPGQIAFLSGGKEVKFNAPNLIGGYNEYKTSNLRTIAAGFRVPYELLSGDLSQVNFSSGRLGLLEFRRLVGSVQQHIVIAMMLQPIWDWFCEAAFLAGVIDQPTVPVEWSVPKLEFINPVDDVQADNLSIRSGLRSWDDVISGNGRDPEVVFAEIMACQARNRAHGVILDSDPSAVSGRGVAQKNDPGLAPIQPKSKKAKKAKKAKTKPNSDLV